MKTFKYDGYLNESDLNDHNKYPLIIYLNAASCMGILTFIETITNEDCGITYENVGGYFWSELDEYEKSQIEPYEGILITYMIDEYEVIISYEELVYYLKLLVSRMHMPKEKENRALELIHEFAKKHDVDD